MTLNFYAQTLFCISSWENKDLYAQAVRALRLRELQNVERMSAVRAGLGSIIPLQLLTMLSPLEMELRTCGLPYINLEFLKVLSFSSMLSPNLTFLLHLLQLNLEVDTLFEVIKTIFFFKHSTDFILAYSFGK